MQTLETAVTSTAATTPPAQFQTLIGDHDIIITEAARLQLAQLLGGIDDDNIEAIRIFVAGGGCSGMTYGMTFTDQCTEYDKIMQGAGYSIYVDAIAHSYIKGVEIDFVTSETGATFVFNNVFQTTGGSGTCGGCGGAAGSHS